MNYKNCIPLAGYKNKPNTNPIRQACVVCEGVAGLIKPNCRKGKIDAKCVFTKDYRKKDDFVVRINKPNFSKNPKCTQTYILQRIMKMNRLPAQKNKAKTNPISIQKKLAKS